MDRVFILSATGVFPLGARRSQLMGRGERISQASCLGENQADMSHWDRGSVLRTIGQRSLHRGPNCIRRRPRPLVALSQIPSVHSPAKFYFHILPSPLLGYRQKNIQFPSWSHSTCASSYISFLSHFLIILSLHHSYFPFFCRAIPSTFTFSPFSTIFQTFYTASCPQHTSLLIHLVFLSFPHIDSWFLNMNPHVPCICWKSFCSTILKLEVLFFYFLLS